MNKEEHEERHDPRGTTQPEKPREDEDQSKSGMHHPSTDPRKQIPAVEGGET